MTALRIAEIFGPTIQGEGALIGAPTVFVRAGGCDYRCSWCDSLHAVDSEYRHDWAKMTTDDIWAKVWDLSGGTPLTVSLSGGNPAIQNFGPLMSMGHAQGYKFALETQGSVAQDWFENLDLLVLSPKPPSSGETVDWDKFDDCLAQAKTARTVLKIVIFDEVDYNWARDVAGRYAALPLYLQPGNHTPPPPDAQDAVIDIDGIIDRMQWLVDKTLGDRWFTPHILPQLHTLIWGNKRGV
ncbi:7-carboxy-7-deazaguanine synthase QueE [Yoonia vestfoldensis]|uniref:7-carboxy-7-deazaguanine synthase n=1 Tax=Yoonia vestfoldensis TaxID=245188 RepID=A0A1Y0E734_9RHOB|nr:7-carboxy-7-deazaguanine synthase QueE [Yoonia vestfoldensis]ART99423.1 7-carboxy-7-deazaguanine synthase [Yoonia vestfoldensis]